MQVRFEPAEVGQAGTGAVVVGSDAVVVRAAVIDNRPEITVGAGDGAWVLRRVDETEEEASAAVAGSATLQWHVEALEGAVGTSVTLTGRSGQLVRAICLMVRPAARWLEVTETISSLEVPLPALEAFESRWRFRGGSEIREVFTPSLVPEEGDHYFPSRIGLAVLRVVAGAAGHGGGEPRAWRSGPAKWRERVRLGLG